MIVSNFIFKYVYLFFKKKGLNIKRLLIFLKKRIKWGLGPILILTQFRNFLGHTQTISNYYYYFFLYGSGLRIASKSGSGSGSSLGLGLDLDLGIMIPTPNPPHYHH